MTKSIARTATAIALTFAMTGTTALITSTTTVVAGKLEVKPRVSLSNQFRATGTQNEADAAYACWGTGDKKFCVNEKEFNQLVANCINAERDCEAVNSAKNP